MREVQIGKKKVKIYDSIEELPMKRFHKYNKMLLIDSGLGSDLSDFDRHISRAAAFLKEGKTEQAIIEMENMRQNIYNIQSGIDPKMLAFACLVAEIEGKAVTDISDDALRALAEEFGDITKKDLTDTMESVKKKIDEELVTYFPKIFESSELKEAWDKVKARTVLVLESIIKKESKAAQIEKIDRELLIYTKPKKFSGKDNAEVEHDKQFERLSLSIRQNLNADTGGMTVLQFYSACEYIAEMLKAREKTHKRK